MKRRAIKVLMVFGTRPEAIKMAPLIIGMKKDPKKFSPIICVTGQHREMLIQILNGFHIAPNYDLDIMTPNQSLSDITAQIIQGIEKILKLENPDLIVVQGDTTTAFASSLVSFYNKIPLAHVEAGLRTGNLNHPFPEELNRILIDRFANFYFAPTKLNKKTLLDEGISAEKIFITGNTGIDALLLVNNRVRFEDPKLWENLWGSAWPVIRDNLSPKILITVHRRESFGLEIKSIFENINRLAIKHLNWNFIYPVHLNPNVREQAKLILTEKSNIHLIEPLPYEPFVFLMGISDLILTDSGGIQEEAPSLGKPVVVLRKTTERMEALEAGTIILADNTGEGLEAIVEEMMLAGGDSMRVKKKNPYGDGNASHKILEIIWREMQRFEY